MLTLPKLSERSDMKSSEFQRLLVYFLVGANINFVDRKYANLFGDAFSKQKRQHRKLKCKSDGIDNFVLLTE